jgi:hypothetical protein
MGITQDQVDGDLILQLREGGKLQMYEVKVSELKLLAPQPKFSFGSGVTTCERSPSYAVYVGPHDENVEALCDLGASGGEGGRAWEFDAMILWPE